MKIETVTYFVRARLLLARARMESDVVRSSSRSRYSDLGSEEQSDPDSYEKFDTNCYSEWIMIRSLMQEHEAIYWVFLSTLKVTTTLINLS